MLVRLQKNNIKNCILVVMLILSTIMIADIGVCQGLKIRHRPLKGYQLPAPGNKMNLEVILPDIKNVDLRVRALTVLDGELIDLSLNGSLDELDRSVYSTTIRAPRAELSYQFIIYPEKGSPIYSKKYRLTRPCLPDKKLAQLKPPEDMNQVEEINWLLDTTRKLDRDIKAYSNVIDILHELKEFAE